MAFSAIAAQIGIEAYPEAMDRVYDKIKDSKALACDLNLITELEQEYGVFGEFFDDVCQTAEAINGDKNRSLWVKTAAVYAKEISLPEVKKIPVPSADGSKVTAYLPLHVLIPLIPVSVKEYQKRGFSEEEITGILANYKTSLSIVREQTGMPGMTDVYFNWQSNFAKARIYQTEGLQFELHTLPKGAVYLKNCVSGEIVAVLTDSLFHTTGIQLVGSKGFEDDKGAFFVSFAEDDENYYGHRSLGKTVDRQKSVFPKVKWECVAKPGDDCLSIHIPRKADISPATLDKAIASARRILKERFPEHKGDRIYAASWILDPTLEEFLPDSSNLMQFAHRFVRYPQKSDGMHVFGFIFPKRFESYETLPENSTLTRGLKKVYMEGRYIYYYHGLSFE